MELFEKILADALAQVASARGWQYRTGGCELWARAGAAYLSFVLLDGLQETVRSLQYQAREECGHVLIDCHQYDVLSALCLGNNGSAQVLLADCGGKMSAVTLTKCLFMEMLDFLREG